MRLSSLREVGAVGGGGQNVANREQADEELIQAIYASLQSVEALEAFFEPYVGDPPSHVMTPKAMKFGCKLIEATQGTQKRLLEILRRRAEGLGG